MIYKNALTLQLQYTPVDLKNKQTLYITVHHGQLVEVDVYGKCGNLSHGGLDPADAERDLEAAYGFYLALENALCKDYVTEKFFRYGSFDLVTASWLKYMSSCKVHLYLIIAN